MSGTKHLEARIRRVQRALLPRPKTINCGHAKDELLAILEQQMTEEERHTPVEWTEEQKHIADSLDAILDARYKEIEGTCNVRLV